MRKKEKRNKKNIQSSLLSIYLKKKKKNLSNIMRVNHVRFCEYKNIKIKEEKKK